MSNARVAIVREVSASIAQCELTFLARDPIDVAKARAQHAAYCAALEAAGVRVVRLPADEAYPDGCFVEDTAVVLDELAILTNPGAPSRRGEIESVARVLAEHRTVARVEAPATLEGGDVLVLAERKQILVGKSTRTNDDGIGSLRSLAQPLGYDVTAVRVPGALHLKSAVSALDDHTLLANRALLLDDDMRALEAMRAPVSGSPALRLVDVAPSEPGAANVLRVREGEVWAHAGYPRSIARIEAAGFRVQALDISELVKAEAALTCLSLLLR